MEKSSFTRTLALMSSSILEYLKPEKHMNARTPWQNKKASSNLVNGFTIVELFMTIAAVTLLLIMGINQFTTVGQKNRDEERISDVKEIRDALDLYEIEKGFFLIKRAEVAITGNDDLSIALKDAGVIKNIPLDPRYPQSTYTYKSDSFGSDYVIKFCLESDKIPDYSKGCNNKIGP
jgi:type II secretory pathway pseudopilin PulG